MKKLFFISLFLLFGQLLVAQNLISNGDFSLKAGTSCDIKHFVTHPDDWEIAPLKYTHTPDFYHTCAGTTSPNYPGSNWNGCADPKTGTGYIGLLAHPEALNAYQDNRFEYVYQILSTDLAQGTSYYIVDP